MSEPQRKKEIAESCAAAIPEGFEAASSEAQKGMGRLLADRQKLIEFLKAGGRSGITNDFGKPSIVNVNESEPMPDSAGEPAVTPLETGKAVEPAATSGKPQLISDKERAKKYRLKQQMQDEFPEIHPFLDSAEQAVITPDPEPTTLVTRQPIDRHFFIGAEVALLVLTASAGVARRRPDKREGDLHGQEEVQPQAEESAEDVIPESGNSLPCEQLPVSPGKVMRRPQMIVSSTDTLTGLAEALYHDPDLGWLIADLNSHNIRESRVEGKRVVELKSRQLLEVPIWEDINEFLSTRPKDAKAENLVTIVVQSAVDREELVAALGQVMGAASSGSAFPDLKLATSVRRFVTRKVEWS